MPCFKRIKTLEYNEGDETTVEADDDDEDGWVETHTGASAAADDGDMDDIAATMKTTTLAEESLQSLTTKGGVHAAEDSDSDDDDIPDMDDFQEENLAEEDPVRSKVCVCVYVVVFIDFCVTGGSCTRGCIWLGQHSQDTLVRSLCDIRQVLPDTATVAHRLRRSTQPILPSYCILAHGSFFLCLCRTESHWT